MTYATQFETARSTLPLHGMDSAVVAVTPVQCAQMLIDGLIRYELGFRRLTWRAAENFQLRDWMSMQMDAVERDELFDRQVRNTVAIATARLESATAHAAFWQEVAFEYSRRVAASADAHIATLFFNSVTRSMCPDYAAMQAQVGAVPVAMIVAGAELRRYACGATLDAAVQQALGDLPLETEWADLAAAAHAAVRDMQHSMAAAQFNASGLRFEMLDTVMYRLTRACAVGRLTDGQRQLPVAMTLRNGEDGVEIDRVLIGEAALVRLLCESTASFQVDLSQGDKALSCLHALLPNQPLSRLAQALGYPV